MKTSSVIKKLGNFKSVQNNGNTYFYSRSVSEQGTDRMVEVVDQDGNAFALPIIIEDGEQRVAFRATTIKSLVEFLENK